eukprot:3292157-Rhodomonas_salina.2
MSSTCKRMREDSPADSPADPPVDPPVDSPKDCDEEARVAYMAFLKEEAASEEATLKGLGLPEMPCKEIKWHLESLAGYLCRREEKWPNSDVTFEFDDANTCTEAMGRIFAQEISQDMEDRELQMYTSVFNFRQYFLFVFDGSHVMLEATEDNQPEEDNGAAAGNELRVPKQFCAVTLEDTTAKEKFGTKRSANSLFVFRNGTGPTEQVSPYENFV